MHGNLGPSLARDPDILRWRALDRVEWAERDSDTALTRAPRRSAAARELTMSIEFDGKRFWFRSGTGGQQQPVPEAVERDLLALIDLFRLHFGRDPEPGDPLLFDPRKTMPTPLPLDDVKTATAQYLEEWVCIRPIERSMPSSGS
jgi:hypothetical protein